MSFCGPLSNAAYAHRYGREQMLKRQLPAEAGDWRYNETDISGQAFRVEERCTAAWNSTCRGAPSLEPSEASGFDRASPRACCLFAFGLHRYLSIEVFRAQREAIDAYVPRSPAIRRRVVFLHLPLRLLGCRSRAPRNDFDRWALFGRSGGR